jgi:hypothetical protein
MRSIGASLALLGVLAVAAVTTAPAAPAAPTVGTYTLDPDLRLTTTRLPTKPVEARTLTITPASDAVPDIVPASTHYPLYTLTSTMSAHAGALASVNGDFGTPRRQPTHVLMIDGELWTSGAQPGAAVAWSEDGSTVQIGRPDLHVAVATPTGTHLFRIEGWNTDALPTASVSAYTARGGTVTVPPGKTSPTSTDPYWCEARLVPVTEARWANKRSVIVRKYTVESQPSPCQQTPLAVGTTAGAVVVATTDTPGVTNPVKRLKPGRNVVIGTRFGAWRGVTDVMGALHMLVHDGVNVAPHYVDGDPYIYNRNPRTAVGITQGCSDLRPGTLCQLFLETVDGRQADTGWSAGLRFPALAKLMLRAGSYNAISLDGGGSTTMWTSVTDPAYCQAYPTAGGCLVMRPSQPTGERATRSAIDVLGSPDTGAPTGLR